MLMGIHHSMDYQAFEWLGCEHYDKNIGVSVPFSHASTDLLIKCKYWCPDDPSISRKKRLTGHREYGLDGIGIRRDEDGQVAYDGLQMKCYRPGGYLDSGKLGSYFGAVLRMRQDLRNGGVLYHATGSRIPAETKMRAHNPAINMRVIELDPTPVSEPQVRDETAFEPRPIQVEALTFLEDCPKAILSMACASGKTLIVGRHVATKRFDRIILVAPLIEQAQQLLTRVSAFVPENPSMAFWSGKELDQDRLQLFLRDNEKCIVATTYASADRVHAALLAVPSSSGTTICVFDEAHNIGYGDDSANHRAHRLAFEGPSDWHVILLTATPPKVFDEILVDRRGFQRFEYGLARAIQDGNCCDYTISLPYIMGRDDAVPIELAGLGDTAKARFHASAMLHDGARRSIAYCSSIQECHDYVEEFRNVCERYLGVRCWTGIITSDVDADSRARLMQEFQEDDDGDDGFFLRCLASVRILDEGIDLPRCDSVFAKCCSGAGSVTERVWARAVQRIFRAGRKDPKNPLKVARVYLWTGDQISESALSEMLWALREADVSVLDKVRYQVADYDRAADPIVRSKQDREIQEWKREWRMKIMNPPEWLRIKISVLIRDYKDRAPGANEVGTFQIDDVILKDFKIGAFTSALVADVDRWTRLDQGLKTQLVEACPWLAERVTNRILEGARVELHPDEDLIKMLLEVYPRMRDEFAFAPSMRSANCNGMFRCDIGTALWRLVRNDEVESALREKFAGPIQDLNDKDRAYIRTRRAIADLRAEFAGHVVRDDFVDRLDANLDLFPLANGVIDVPGKTFRLRTPEDYGSLHTGWRYDVGEQNEEAREGVRDCLARLFPVEDERQVVLRYIAGLLSGRRFVRKILVLKNTKTFPTFLRGFFGNLAKDSQLLFTTSKKVGDSLLVQDASKRLLLMTGDGSSLRMNRGVLKRVTDGPGTRVDGSKVLQCGIVAVLENSQDIIVLDEEDRKRMLIVNAQVEDERDVDKFEGWHRAFLEMLLEESYSTEEVVQARASVQTDSLEAWLQSSIRRTGSNDDVLLVKDLKAMYCKRVNSAVQDFAVIANNWFLKNNFRYKENTKIKLPCGAWKTERGVAYGCRLSQ
jgi:superfamily II DNA or RNA helicase